MGIDPFVMKRRILPNWNFWGWNNDEIHRWSEKKRGKKKVTEERERIKLQQLIWVKFVFDDWKSIFKFDYWRGNLIIDNCYC